MNEFLEFGLITNARGLKGELKVNPFCDYKEQYEDVSSVFINNKNYEIEYVKYHKEQVILKLKTIDSVEDAEKLRNTPITVQRADLPPLPAGSYYIVDLLGLRGVFDNGESVGTLSNILQTGAADIYEFKDENDKTVLIPKVAEFIAEVDINHKTIRLTEKAKELIF